MKQFTLTDKWIDDADLYIYEETTADGYTVYVATSDPSNIDISEEVYYYDTDLEDVWYKALKNGSKIYADDLDSYQLSDALLKLNDEREGNN